MLDYKAIGRRIAFYRKKAPLTQAELAEKIGFSESYMSQVECGKAKISLTRLNDIAEILKINIALFVSDSNIDSENYGYSEFIEIIKHWSTEKKVFLLGMLKYADEQFTSLSLEKNGPL